MFAVVGESQAGPVLRVGVQGRGLGGDVRVCVESGEVEGFEGGFVEVAEVVEEDGGCGWGCDCEDGGGGVVGC